MPSKYRVTTDQGTYEVTVDDTKPSDAPVFQEESDRIDQEVARWKALGVPTDDAGVPNSGKGPTWQQKYAYTMKYPTPGMQLAGDVAAVAAGAFGPRLSGQTAITKENIGGAGKMAADIGTSPFKAIMRKIGIDPQAMEKETAQNELAATRLRLQAVQSRGRQAGLRTGLQEIPQPPQGPSPMPPGFERYGPNVSAPTSGYGPSASGVGGSPIDIHMPNVSGAPQHVGFAPSAADVRLPASPIDIHMPNVSGVAPGFGQSAAGLPTPQSPIDIHLPNVSAGPTTGYGPSAADFLSDLDIEKLRAGAGGEGPFEDPAAMLAQRLGTPSDTEMADSVGVMNAKAAIRKAVLDQLKKQTTK